MTAIPRSKIGFLARTAFVAILITPVATPAQDNQTAPPLIDSFSLPPGQNQTQPAPPVVVVPTVPQNQTTPAPTPVPVPAPTTPSPTPSRAQDPAPETPARPPAPVEDSAPDQTVAPDLPGNDVASPELSTQPPVVEPAPAPATPQSASGRNWIGWIVAALALLAAIAAFLFWRRRSPREEFDEEPVYEQAPEPQPETETETETDPDLVARAEREAAPVEPAALVEQVALAEAAPAEVAAATTPAALADGRPWIEFALRPIKAGVNVVDAMVEFELTVGNAGSEPAEDVRIAAWLLSANPGQDDEIARFLENLPAEAVMEPFTVDPGDAKRVDAAIALPRTGLNVVTARDRPFFVPLIVADARYRLPDGGEGRTSATFVVGTVRQGQEKLGPIWLDRGVRMHDAVEARLHGDLARR